VRSRFSRRLRGGFFAALVGSLAVAAVAVADGAGDNVSRMSANFNSPLQDDTKFGKGSLWVQVETVDADGNDQSVEPDAADRGPWAVAEFEAEEVYIDFDDDIRLQLNPVASGKETLKTCSPATLAGTDTDAAIAACPKALIGAGTAHANLAPAPGGAAATAIPVTVFNGPETTAGGPCTDPTTNGGVGGPSGCEFQGGNPQVILHTRIASPATTTLTLGEIQDSPLGGDFGSRLAVTNAPDIGGGSLNLFGSQLERAWDNGKSGDQLKKFNVASARCDGEWNFTTQWVYDDNTSESDAHTAPCAQK
jgi:hypothetical protein